MRTSIAVPQSFSAAVSHSSHRLLWPPLDGAISLTPPECLLVVARRPTVHRVGVKGGRVEPSMSIVWFAIPSFIFLFVRFSGILRFAL